ncbi:AI-2E family transporter [Pseudomonas duriflava]|nr:AI-2E family transporter [Pseudomonas duriflava]
MQLLSSRQILLSSWFVILASLMLVFPLGLVPSLFAGLLVFELANMLEPRLQLLIPGNRARIVAVALLVTLVVCVLAVGFAGAISFVLHEVRNPGSLIDKFMVLTERARGQLPLSVDKYLPASAEELRRAVNEWLVAHLSELQMVGKGAVHTFVTMLIGLILGAAVALQRKRSVADERPLASALLDRVSLLSQAFHRVVFAQVKISAINTVLTAIFLAGVLPLFGIHLPLTKTLIVLTFIVGLLPVIGNLISNTFILIAGLSVSLWVAVAVGCYLVTIHKLEYFLNARIVGGQINARSWELLLAMLVFESAFGLPGLVAAPIYYAYVKSELIRAELV